MSTTVLERKLIELQQRVAEIEAKISRPEAKDWRKIAGAAAGDKYFAEAMRLGSQWRKKANTENW